MCAAGLRTISKAPQPDRREAKMIRVLRLAVLVTMLLSVASFCTAQMQMPKPAPELKQYDYFVGSWKLDGDAKPSPMGPGGKMTMTEDVHWMQGWLHALSSASDTAGVRVRAHWNGISLRCRVLECHLLVRQHTSVESETGYPGGATWL